MVFGAGYSLWLLNRLLFGNMKTTSMSSFKDVSRFELAILTPFVFLTFMLGIFPQVIITLITIY
jgi:NADH-quinone oxidoreductase subunit M